MSISSASRVIKPAGPGVAAFVGESPVGSDSCEPKLVSSFADFEAVFGGRDARAKHGRGSHDLLAHCVRAFFANGGARVYVARVSDAGGAEETVASYGEGLAALEDVADISVVATPGSTAGRSVETSATIAQALVDHCARLRYRFGLIDPPADQSADDVRDYRRRFDSSHAAIYYPWVSVEDPDTGQPVNLPPSGFMAGVLARVDAEAGVHTSAGGQELRLAAGLESSLDTAQNDLLNAENINCLRFFPARGHVVWGGRTVSSDPEWKYVNVRRYFLFIEESIDEGTQWVVFEPNGEPLWNSVRAAIEGFLTAEWQAGRLAGATADQAFFVRCDRTTMTEDDILNGRLICLVGVAVVRPAEFVILRIGQNTAG